MAQKIKCDECRRWHGGFHLCVGAGAPVELMTGDRIYQTQSTPHVNLGKAAGPKARWAAYHQETLERDQNILKQYRSGLSLVQVGDNFELSKTSVRAIILRMGGTLRSRSEQASRRIP